MDRDTRAYRDADGIEYPDTQCEGCTFTGTGGEGMPDVTPPAVAVFDAEKKKRAKSIFSLSHLSLVAFVLVSQSLGSVIQLVLMLLLPQELLEGSAVLGYITMGINVVAMYMTAFPIFLLISRAIPRATRPEPSKMGIGELLVMLLIAECAMLIGAIIGNLFNGLVNILTGVMPDNSIDTIVNSIPLWLTAAVVVVIGPIIEEIMFRRVLIDRLSACGDRAAILFSAIAFGVFHGNLYQLFYATLVGIILGYVYAKTRRLRYSIILHMLVNFMGSLLPLGIERLGSVVSEQLSLTLTSIYGILQYSMIVFGIIAAALYVIRCGVHFNEKCDIPVPRGERLKTYLCNPGVLIFYVISANIMITTILVEVVSYYLGA